jgi:hypothetical protein
VKRAAIRLFRWNQEQFGNEYLDITGTVDEVDAEFLRLTDEDPNWRIFAWSVEED